MHMGLPRLLGPEAGALTLVGGFTGTSFRACAALSSFPRDPAWFELSARVELGLGGAKADSAV
jgi:hypothetical protein